MIIQLNNVCKSFGVDIILKDITFKVEERERVGLIGQNGAGKSTIFKIITGELSKDSGDVFIGNGAKIGFLRQEMPFDSVNNIWDEMMSVFSKITAVEKELRLLEKQMSKSHNEKMLEDYAKKSEYFQQNDGFLLKAKIETILNGMGFGNFDVETPIVNLSGGERTRLAMAKILLQEPDILMLDEPTNHLDFQVLSWLEDYLQNYKGAILVVSHDRFFLDTVCQTILELENTKMTRYVGNYTSYLTQREQNIQLLEKEAVATQKEINRLTEYVEKNMARASTSKSAKSKQKALNKIEPVVVPKNSIARPKFKFDVEHTSHKDVLTVENLSVFIGGVKKLSEHISFEIKRGEKIGLIGGNGLGKTTLFKTLLGEHADYKGKYTWGNKVKISYYSQQQENLHLEKTAIDEIWDRYPRLDQTVVRTLLGNMLFTEDDVFKEVNKLSGGEKAKLSLLNLMLQQGNVLMFDEPTNHLDLPSKEALDKALSKYEGTVFFISHDRYLLNKVADKIFQLTPNGVQFFNGNYDYFKEKSENKIAEVVETKKTNDYQENKRIQAKERAKQRKLENFAIEIEETENKINKLTKETEALGTDYVALQEKYAEIEVENKKLEELYDAWGEMDGELS